MLSKSLLHNNLTLHRGSTAWAAHLHGKRTQDARVQPKYVPCADVGGGLWGCSRRGGRGLAGLLGRLDGHLPISIAATAAITLCACMCVIHQRQRLLRCRLWNLLGCHT